MSGSGDISRAVRDGLRQARGYSLLAFLLALIGVFLVYPIALTVGGAVTEHREDGTTRFTLSHLALVLQDPGFRECLFNSLRMALTTTTVCLLIAVPLAVLTAKFVFPLKPVFGALILVPLILPPFVGAIGMQALMGREGAFSTLAGGLFGAKFDFLGHAKFWGCVLVDSLHLYPIIYLNAAAALANLDPALEEAADNLGCGPWRRFLTITLPLIRPGVFAGATIVFIWSFTELGTPLIFDYTRVLPVQVFFKLKEVEASPEPYALVIVMLAVSVTLYVAGKYLLAGRAYPMYAKASRAATETRLTGARGLLAAGAFGGVTLLALMPHAGVVLTAMTAPGKWYASVLPTEVTGRNFVKALSHPEAFTSIVNSLKLSLAAVAIAVGFGLLASYVIVRTRVRGRGLLDAACMLPLAVPGIVVAFGYVAMSLGWPFRAREGGWAPLSFVSVLGGSPAPFLLIVAAYAFRRMPYIVRSTVAGLEQTSGELEEAAMNLGAGRVRAVRAVILPLIMANLVAGCLLAFSFSMLAVSEPLLLAQAQKDFPITKAIYSFLNRLGDGPFIASAMGVWGMALLAVTLVGASILLGKKLGSIFRV
jgi:iron(III) transport system permease protein